MAVSQQSVSPSLFSSAAVANRSCRLWGAAPWSPAPRVDTALVKAIVRAHRWRQMIESGEYSSSAELARTEKINESYLGRILRLTLIAPDITEAILAGRQPSTLQLDDLLKPLPSGWAEQHSALFNPD
ncbi:MAG: hypothetical protein ACLQDM_07000 [Bradyrhizobium sp.]